jgi:hypothetical protein
MINESIQLANTYTNIDNVHGNSDHNANALEYYNKAVDIHSKKNNQLNPLSICSTLIIIRSWIKIKWGKAISILQELILSER